MTAKITASTSSGLVLDSDMSGSLALVANGVTVATLNGTGANAGIQLGTSMAPAFSAYIQGNQTVAHNTAVKLQFNTETYDTNGNYDPTTNYRFTPTVAGYYQVNIRVVHVGTASRQYAFIPCLYKNGSSILAIEHDIAMGSSCDHFVTTLQHLIYLNGSSDYIEVYVNNYDFTSSASTIAVGNFANGSSFSAYLARTA